MTKQKINSIRKLIKQRIVLQEELKSLDEYGKKINKMKNLLKE